MCDSVRVLVVMGVAYIWTDVGELGWREGGWGGLSGLDL